MDERERNHGKIDLYQIPSDPKPGQIIELLSKLPSEMGYVQNQLVELENRKNLLKAQLKGKKRACDLEMSKIRLTISKHYREKIQSWVNESAKKIDDLVQTGLTRTEAKDMIKMLKPERPTKNDLDDLALVRTENLQREIEHFENQLIEIENAYEAKKVMFNILDNNFRATISIKGLVQRDMEL